MCMYVVGCEHHTHMGLSLVAQVVCMNGVDASMIMLLFICLVKCVLFMSML